MSEPTSKDPAFLKEVALANLRRAQHHAGQAAFALQNLEGTGYCAQWEQTRKLVDQIEKRHALISKLKSPTGVFQL